MNIFHLDSIRSDGEYYSVFVSGVKKWQDDGNEVVSPAKGLHFIKSVSDLYMGMMLAVSSHAAGEEPTYWYQIKDISNDWQEIKSSNLMRLDGLPYGTYEVAGVTILLPVVVYLVGRSYRVAHRVWGLQVQARTDIKVPAASGTDSQRYA